MRTTAYLLVLCVGVAWVPGIQGRPQPPSPDPGSDKHPTVQSSALPQRKLVRITESYSAIQSERSPASVHVLVDTADKEVNIVSVLKSNHQLFHASLQSRNLQQVKTSESSSKFYKSLTSTGADGRGDFGKSEALSQEDGEGQPRKDRPMSKMVVTIISTITALVSMSMLVAIFQCCCRRNKRRSSEAKGSEDNGRASVNKEDEKPSKEEEKPLNEEGQQDEPDLESEADSEPVVLRRQDRESSEEKDVSVKNRIKAFEVKPASPSSPESRAQVMKKRPESDAFRAFEKKGILIGMGRTKPKVTIEEDEDGNGEPDTSDQSPISIKVSPTVSPKPAKSPAVSPKPRVDPEKSRLYPDNLDPSRLYPDKPDVVIASDDEDDEFSVIKRESEVLKSFSKPTAPKTRNRTSQAIAGRRARATNSPAKPVSMIDEKSEEKAVTSPLLNSKETEEFKTKEEKQKLLQSVMEKSVTKSITKESVASGTEADKHSASPSQDSSPVLQSDIDTSGNIFLQIDPTAKRRSTGSTPVQSPKKESSTSAERPKSTHEVVKSSPRPSPKPSPKPIRDDQLMKALSERLKKQSPDKEKADDL